MKTKIPSKFILFVLLGALALVNVSCGDDDIEPVGMTDDTPDPTDDGMDPTDDGDGMDPTDDDPMISDNPVLRINVGGGEVAYGDIVFTEDQFFTEPSEGFSNTDIGDFGDTDMDELYETERIVGMVRGSYGYEIPITNGTYNVKLHFAEIYWGAAEPNGDPTGGVGSRVFDVDIEGQVVLNDLDIFDEVGVGTALVRTFEVTIEDGEMNIILTASEDRPKLSALEVLGDGEITSGG